MADKGILYVIAAPSGAGKTTLVNALVKSLSNLSISISHTTRNKRPNETDGVDYYFTDVDTFKKMIANRDFLEYATVFDRNYGTSKKWVVDTLAKGTDVILEIDWQGHQQIKKLMPEAISIFILPPSLKELKERLITRNQDDAKTIKKRLADAKETVSHIAEFDYVVVNDEFEIALSDLKSIIQAGRLVARRQTAKYEAMLADLG